MMAFNSDAKRLIVFMLKFLLICLVIVGKVKNSGLHSAYDGTTLSKPQEIKEH